jgi:hypothetical protein
MDRKIKFMKIIFMSGVIYGLCWYSSHTGYLSLLKNRKSKM